MQEDFQKFDMPNGEVCYYRERDHSYWLGIEPKKRSEPHMEWKGCERLTGISTCAGGLEFNADPLMRWAAKINVEGIASLVAPLLGYEGVTVGDLSWLTQPESIQRELLRGGLTYDQLREQRAVEGTNVHKHALHALACGKPVPDYSELDERERGFAKGVVQFWLDHEPRPLQAEAVVMNKSLGIAGRFDLRYMTKQNTTTMLDAKTSGYIGNGAHVQVGGYDFAAASVGFGSSDERVILQVHEDGRYTLIPVKATREDFYCAVEAYRRSKRINREANADRKAREQ